MFKISRILYLFARIFFSLRGLLTPRAPERRSLGVFWPAVHAPRISFFSFCNFPREFLCFSLRKSVEISVFFCFRKILLNFAHFSAHKQFSRVHQAPRKAWERCARGVCEWRENGHAFVKRWNFSSYRKRAPQAHGGRVGGGGRVKNRKGGWIWLSFCD